MGKDRNKLHEEITEYINVNIYNSKDFDKLNIDNQTIAINEAIENLYSFYKAYHPEKKPIPVQALAYQTMWLVEKASFRMSELGVASQSIEGMTQTFRGMDKTIAPEVKRILRNRVGSYHISVSDTNRHMIGGY